MLNQEEFVAKVEEEFLSYLSKEFNKENYQVSIQEHMLSIKSKIGADMIDAPVIQLEGIYQIYVNEGGNFENTIQKLAATYEMAYRNAPLKEEEKKKSSEETDIDLKKVFFQVINKGKIGENRQSIPYTEKGEMALIYRQLVEKSKEGIKSFIIDMQMLEEQNISKESLIQAAKDNTPELFPAEIKKIEGIPMYEVTNQLHTLGAAVLFYKDNPLDELSTNLDSDLLVIPENTNEIFVIDAKSQDKNIRSTLAQELNEILAGLSDSDVIAYHTLLFKKDEKMLFPCIAESNEKNIANTVRR